MNNIIGLKYGLMDCKDKLWLGNADGPKLFDDNCKACAAATILSEQLYRDIRAIPYDGENVTLRDEIDSVMSFEQAVNNIESETR